MYKSDLMALQDIQNNTICVKTAKGIRTMMEKNDINENLVYVHNMSRLEDSNEFKIKTGEYCRYIDVIIMPKMNL